MTVSVMHMPYNFAIRWKLIRVHGSCSLAQCHTACHISLMTEKDYLFYHDVAYINILKHT